MKKLVLLFVLAVLIPSFILAGLVWRSLQDQQIVLEKKQALLYQKIADEKADQIRQWLRSFPHYLRRLTDEWLSQESPLTIAREFDARLRQQWPFVEVGFAVTAEGQLYSPTDRNQERVKQFLRANELFLTNQEIVEAYPDNFSRLNSQLAYRDSERKEISSASGGSYDITASEESYHAPVDAGKKIAQRALSEKAELDVAQEEQKKDSAPNHRKLFSKAQSAPAPASAPEPASKSLEQVKLKRAVAPQKNVALVDETFSQSVRVRGDFWELLGENTEGFLARFLENRLCLQLWYTPPEHKHWVFGAQVQLERIQKELPLFFKKDVANEEMCLAVLNDQGQPVFHTAEQNFQTNWTKPFVASEIGEMLPHWEIGVYILDPQKMERNAAAARAVLGLLVMALVTAIGFGGLLLVWDMRRQMVLARQKTDFVSNVSHELKTPLTSIRMFGELLNASDDIHPDKRKQYAEIIMNEAARLTRLIHNVLDFARIERKEKQYRWESFDIVALVKELFAQHEQRWKGLGFSVEWKTQQPEIWITADRDGVTQVLVNLFSNAEKYSAQQKEIYMEIIAHVQEIEILVCDRGIGIPPQCEKKIFRKFYRVDDRLSSGVAGSGLGLTLSREVARAHGGDVTYQARPGGGSCFLFRLPKQPL